MTKNLESEEDQQGNGETASGWDAAGNPAVRELLDHLAAELAAEYVRLMKTAAAASCRPAKTSDQEE